jgi:Mg2+ and Co2+ transporter CorA
VHGPVNPAVRDEVAMEETRAVARRLETGRLRPTSAAELSFAVVTALTGRLRELLSTLTEEVWQLERQVTAGRGGDPEQFLAELFAVRHGLLAVRTMATLAIWPGPGHALLLDVEDRFRRIGAMAEAQREYLPCGGGVGGHDRRSLRVCGACRRRRLVAPPTPRSALTGCGPLWGDVITIDGLLGTSSR